MIVVRFWVVNPKGKSTDRVSLQDEERKLKSTCLNRHICVQMKLFSFCKLNIVPLDNLSIVFHLHSLDFSR